MSYFKLFEENKNLNMYEIKKNKIILDSKPTTLVLIPTTKCNLKCIMCPRKENVNYTLPYEIFDKLSTLFPYLEIINWCGGGEVFTVEYLRKLFIEKLSYYPNIRHDVTTNGLLIDNDLAEILVQNNVYLTYSIDSVNKETYEKIRKGAKFEDLLRSIEIVNNARYKHKSKIRLLLSAVIMELNYSEVCLFPEFCKKYSFNQLRFEYLRPVIDENIDIFTRRKNIKAIDYLSKVIPEIKFKCEEFKISFESYIDLFLAANDTIVQSEITTTNMIYKCKSPWIKIMIDAGTMGNIYPDCLCKKSIGNIFENTIEEVWNNEIMQNYRRSIMEMKNTDYCAVECVTYNRW